MLERACRPLLLCRSALNTCPLDKVRVVILGQVGGGAGCKERVQGCPAEVASMHKQGQALQLCFCCILWLPAPRPAFPLNYTVWPATFGCPWYIATGSVPRPGAGHGAVLQRPAGGQQHKCRVGRGQL